MRSSGERTSGNLGRCLNVHILGCGLANRPPKTSESIGRHPAFAFICYVSIRPGISATVVRFASEEFFNEDKF
jgi:hypothetical protein